MGGKTRGQSLKNLVPHRAAHVDAVLLTAVCLLYLALAIGTARTKLPWEDEGWFASPAVTLLTQGYMGTAVLQSPEGTGAHLEGLDRYTYWVMPLYLVTQAVWYKVLGFSLFSMRALSISWGLVALLVWFVVVKVLSGNPRIALLAVSLIAVDSTFVSRAAEGRMDIMCTALSIGGCAVYLLARTRSLDGAIVISHTLVALGGLTHPNAALGGLALLYLTWYFDRSHLRAYHLPLAAAPYALAAVAWGLYILQAPALFVSQFGGNASGRLSGLAAPLDAIKAEIVTRHLEGHGLGGHWAGSVVRLKLLVLLAYAIGVGASATIRAIREQKGCRPLLVLTAVTFGFMSLFIGIKAHVHLIHIIPLYAALVAFTLYGAWTKRLLPAPLVITAAAGLFSLQIGGVAYAMSKNPYGTQYMPAVSFLSRQIEQTPGLVLGTAELGFQLGFTDQLVDDLAMGYYSGKRPRYLVVNPRYEEHWRQVAISHPDLWRYVDGARREEYRKLYDYNGYKIYARRSPV
jgi:4-amino-4-deoxy-L-arabinose transferase-like glycosyltransferase